MTNCQSGWFRNFVWAALFILLSSPVWSSENKLSGIPTTSYCLEARKGQEATIDQISEDDVWIEVVVRDGAKTPQIQDYNFGPFQSGLLFEIDGQQLLHCSGDGDTPTFILVEDGIMHKFLSMEEKRVTRIHILSRSACGVPCYFSRLHTLVFFQDGAEPDGFKEFDSAIYDYPSKWFTSYLTDRERQRLFTALEMIDE